MLVTKSAFSRVAGVSAAAVSKAARVGFLKKAVCQGKIDTESETARAYLRQKGIDPGDAFSDRTQVNPAPPGVMITLPSGQTDPKEFEGKTLSELCALFGTDSRFKVWMEARKKITDIEKNEIANEKAKGLLVSRDLIKKGVVDPIDAAFATLLTDTAKTIAIRATAMAKSGSEMEDIKSFVVDQISSVIRPAKTKAIKILREAGG